MLYTHKVNKKVCACFFPTLAVSVVGHLDLEAGETCVSVELTVVAVCLTVTATH